MDDWSVLSAIFPSAEIAAISVTFILQYANSIDLTKVERDGQAWSPSHPTLLRSRRRDFDGLTVPSLMTVVNERVWTEQMKVTRLKIKVVNMQISFRRLSPDAIIPEYKTAGACAFDIAVTEEKILQPGERALLSTGLVVAVPAGHALLLFSRSSNAKKGIRLSNSVGVVDQDYCGPTDELKCALHNFGQEPYSIQKGERVAQGLIVPCVRGAFTEVTDLNAPDRGGFGTTG